ncbi:MAG TPA: ASCH domain-containing protein [Gaiellaceae bacterium]|nr:ASCH domain-containing protein [Gaiellaceae bacterium]
MNGLPVFELGHPRTELRRQLVDAVLSREKTATAGLLEEYEAEGEQPEPVGSRCTLLGYDDEPVAVIEVTESRVLPAAEIDEQFARDEGEGYDTVNAWREAHERFFERPIEPGTQIVAVRFRLVERL